MLLPDEKMMLMMMSFGSTYLLLSLPALPSLFHHPCRRRRTVDVWSERNQKIGKEVVGLIDIQPADLR